MKKKLEEILKNRYIWVVGLLILILPFVIVMLFFSESYALEGFGEFNITCDKNIAMAGEEITCDIKGIVADTSTVSAIASRVELSNNLEFVSFVKAGDENYWQGDGTDGKIVLYTDSDKTGTFDIGILKIMVKEDSVNTIENIKLVENEIAEGQTGDYGLQIIDDVSVEIKTPQFTSKVYNMDNNYLLLKNKNVSDVISSINTEGCDVVVQKGSDSVTSGEVNSDTKVKIVRSDSILKEYDIVYVNSDKYDLTKEYIIDTNDDFSYIGNNFELINSTISVKNGQVVASYNSTGILSYDLLLINSDKYKINLDKEYIIVDEEVSDNILSNITNSDNVSLSISDNKLNITYKENIVKSLNIITIKSDKYNVDLVNNYIYVGSDNINNDILTNVSSSNELTVKDNKLNIKFNDEVVYSLNIINIKTDKYLLNVNEDYIYTKNDKNLSNIMNSMNVINGSLSSYNGKIVLKNNNNTIDEFNIYYFDTNNVVDDETVYIRESMEFSNFIQTISVSGFDMKVYNANGVEMSAGNVSDDCSVKFYKGDTLLDTYSVRVEYLDITNLSVNEEEKIIYNLTLGTSYNEILSNISTSGEVSIYKEVKGEKTAVSKDSEVKTNDVVVIKLSSKTVEYVISVVGDLNGTGSVDGGDIAKLYQNVKEKNQFNNAEILAGDVNYNGVIDGGDVAKLYTYLKGKLPNLK